MKILFIDGTAGYHPTRLETKPTGGILTSLTLIPRYLAAQGHDVSVMSIYNEEHEYQGVKHLKHPTDRTDFDVVVFNRNLINRDLINQFKASRKIWWLHDIVDPTYLCDDAFNYVDDIVALSSYCRMSYSDFYGIDKGRFSIIPNGVDKSVFKRGDFDKRRTDLFISASAPVKGVYPLEYAFSNMKRWNPRMEMRLYSSQSLHELPNMDAHKTLFKRIEAVGGQVLDPVPQKELAVVFQTATALLMPNHYPEICSNLLLQAQACGLPVIASSIGSAEEFIVHRETGMLTRRTPSDMFWWWKDFTKQCAAVYFEEGLRSDIAINAPLHVPSWEDVGERWNALLCESKVGV